MKANIYFFLLSCIMLAVASNGNCFAGPEPVILLHDQAVHYNIGKNVYLLEDKGGELAFAQVLAIDTAFQKSQQEIPVLGPSSSAVWCSFKVRNESGTAIWYLEIGNPNLNKVDLYEPGPAGDYYVVKAGTEAPFGERRIKTNRIILPLEINPGSEKTYFIRFQSRNILRFPIRISTMPGLYEKNHALDLANGLYFGLMGSLLVFNLFVFFSLRDKAYFYYVLYILCLTLDVASIRGYIHEWLPEAFMWLVHNRIFSGLTIFFGLIFANTFLQVKNHLPELYPWRRAIYASVAIIFLLSLLQYYVWSFAWMLLTLIPSFIYTYLAGVLIYKKGFKPALYLTIAYGAIGVGIAIYALKDNNLLPETPFTESAMQLGSVIEAIVLSFALASKFKHYKLEIHEAQELAIKQSNAFSQQLIQSQEYERKRIAAELHDSVGQSLILIKNKVLLLRKWLDEPLKVAHYAQDLTESVTNTINEVRTISYALRPFQLDMLGLTQSVRSLADEVSEASGIEVTVEIDELDGVFPKNDEINLYRIVQECLNNIVKHSGATQAKLLLSRNEQVVQVKIEDNGKGMPVSSTASEGRHGFGLLGIQERINILDGNWLIKEAVPHGTIIHISIPIAVIYANH